MASYAFNILIWPARVYIVAVIKRKSLEPILPFIVQQDFDRNFVSFAIYPRVRLFGALTLTQPRKLATSAL